MAETAIDQVGKMHNLLRAVITESCRVFRTNLQVFKLKKIHDDSFIEQMETIVDEIERDIKQVVINTSLTKTVSNTVYAICKYRSKFIAVFEDIKEKNSSGTIPSDTDTEAAIENMKKQLLSNRWKQLMKQVNATADRLSLIDAS